MFIPVLDLNIQADAVVWVSDAVAKRRQLRRTRRGRKAPCRKPRANRLRAEAKIAPSTKARWQWKLRLANVLCMTPFRWHRRQLHRLEPERGAKRPVCRLVKLLRWRTRLLTLPEIGMGLRAGTK